MQHSRHDARILGALTLASALVLGLAAPSYGPVSAAPLARSAVAPSARPEHRWPTHTAAPARPEASAARPQTPAAAPSSETVQVETARPWYASDPNLPESQEGFGGDDLFEWDGPWFDSAAWELARFHRMNTWRQRWSEWRAQQRRARLYDILQPGDATEGDDPSARRVDVCAVFAGACGRRRTTTVTRAIEHPATLREASGRWVLDNDLARVEVNPAQLCALAVQRVGLAQNPALSFATPTPADGCTVSPGGAAEGASITLDFTGNGWSQRVVLSLADGADAPEATVSVVRARGGGHTDTFLANLSGQAQTWTVRGREVSLAAGALGHVQG